MHHLNFVIIFAIVIFSSFGFFGSQLSAFSKHFESERARDLRRLGDLATGEVVRDKFGASSSSRKKSE